MTDPKQDDTEEQVAPARSRRHWSWWSLLGTLLVVLVLCAAVLGGLLYSHGRVIQAPDWLRSYAEEQFSIALPGADVRFDNLTIEVEADWHPRILLERVIITPADGSPEVGFSEAETSLSYRRLLQRQIAPRDIRLSGVFLNVRREAAGDVGVALGQASLGQSVSEERENTDLTEVIAQIDDWLQLAQFERLTHVNVDAVTIQFDDLRANRSWTVDGGLVNLLRDGQDLRISSNFALLGGRDYVSTVEFNYASQIGETAASLGATIEDVPAEDISTQSAALAWLEILRAPISGAVRIDVDETGNLGPLSATLQIAPGVIQPSGAARPIPFEAARSYFTFSPDTNTIQFDELFVQSDWLTARAEGKAHLDEFDGGLPNALIAQIKTTELSGNPADLFLETLAIDQVQADLRLRLDPFELHVGEMLIQDQGQSLVLDAKLSASEDDWNVALNAHMDALEAKRVVEWWPENAIPKTRKWADENIYEGRLTDLNFALRSKPGSRPDIYLDFDFEDADLRYSRKLPILTEAKGQAVLEKDRFVVTAHEGQISPGQGGAIDVSGTHFVIPNTRIKPAPAEIHLKTDATMTATLALLDHDPLSFLSKANLPVDLAEGFATLSGQLSLPLVKGVKPDQIQYDLTAELTDLRSDHFTENKTIAAQRLIARATPEGLTLSGAGRIGSVPFDARFTAALQPNSGVPSRLTGSIEFSERFIDEFNIGLTRDLVSGQGRGDFELTLQKDQPAKFAVTSDTKGLRMAIPSLGWAKSAGQTASLSVEGLLGQPLSVQSLRLDAPGLKAAGAISLKDGGGLDRVSLSDVRIGNWLNVAADLIGRKGRTPDIQIRSGQLDLRNAPSAGSGAGENASGVNMTASLDRVTISEGITLTDLSGNFSTTGGFNGQFESRVNGGAVINGVIVPDNGRSAVRIRSQDAGGTLRSAGILKQARGGELDVTLRPDGPEGHFNGTLRASSVRVTDAPAMAELLNALSIVGLLEQLSGEGINFAEVAAQFKLTPTYAHLTQGSAAGPSMGISMDGIYNLTNQQLDMQGVISPIYVLNAVGRPISRRGEGLLGFNYRLSGPADKPAVSVNPLSVLTPGFLRDIFRRPTQVPEADGTTASE